MSIQVSPPLPVTTASLGAGFSATRLVIARVAGMTQPVMGMDHFRMSDVTFAPHPHAGFSAVSYVFEDSPGKLRNRDSLGNDFVVGPGSLIWTQAARGVVHDERPAQLGEMVHGVQIFVNLSSRNKESAPEVFRLDGEDVPVWTGEGGDRVRVVVGAYGGLSSPVVPVEPFRLLDVSLAGGIDLDLPAGWQTLVYVLSGEVALGAGTHSLGAAQALALRGEGILRLSAIAPAHLLVLGGIPADEPALSYGPFIMSSEEQITRAIARFQAGEMGELESID